MEAKNDNGGTVSEPKQDPGDDEFPKQNAKGKRSGDFKDGENLLKDTYTMDECSEFSSEESIVKENNNKINNNKKFSITAKDKEYYEFIQAISEDRIQDVEQICSASKSHGLLNRMSAEGMLPIHYAVLNASVKCFLFLYNKKVQLDKEVEGLPLIHLSLSNAIFLKRRENCSEIFNFLMKNLDGSKSATDRLGRTYLHLIIEYDFSSALDNIEVDIDELFVKDNNNEFAINYFYIYRSYKTFYKISKDQSFLQELYLKIQRKFEENRAEGELGKEKFLEMCFLYQNYDVIIFLILNSRSLSDTLKKDLETILDHYIKLENSKAEIELEELHSLTENIKYALNFLVERQTNNDSATSKDFTFPCNIINKTAIVYNRDCIKHIQLPDDPIKHIFKRNEMFENSDRLDCLTNTKNGIILNDALFNYNYSPPNSKSNFLFCESQRKVYLCDILRCHDITYINSLKKKCEMLKTGNFKEGKDGIIYGFNKAGASLSMNSSTKKKEGNHLKHEEKNANNLFNYVKIDVDTFINEYTYENIFNTAGCVFDAIDLVMSGKSKNAFALIRPPGHHAGYHGPVENPIVDSEGFCIVNNVAIGAAYAKTQYRDKLIKPTIASL